MVQMIDDWGIKQFPTDVQAGGGGHQRIVHGTACGHMFFSAIECLRDKYYEELGAVELMAATQNVLSTAQEYYLLVPQARLTKMMDSLKKFAYATGARAVQYLIDKTDLSLDSLTADVDEHHHQGQGRHRGVARSALALRQHRRRDHRAASPRGQPAVDHRAEGGRQAVSRRRLRDLGEPAALYILRCSKKLYAWGEDREAEDTDNVRTFFDLIAKDPEIVKNVLLLTGAIEGTKESVREYMRSFGRYDWLWKNDMNTECNQFMKTEPALEDFEGKLKYYMDVENEMAGLDRSAEQQLVPAGPNPVPPGPN